MSKLGGKSIICAARGTAVAIVAGVSGAKLKGVLTWSARAPRDPQEQTRWEDE